MFDFIWDNLGSSSAGPSNFVFGSSSGSPTTQLGPNDVRSSPTRPPDSLETKTRERHRNSSSNVENPKGAEACLAGQEEEETTQCQPMEGVSNAHSVASVQSDPPKSDQCR